MHSSSLFNLSTLGYFLGLFTFGFNIMNSKRAIVSFGLVIVASSFFLQTAGLFKRWLEAGELEVLALEKSLGIALEGKSWFVIFSQHPPWSNLYEILVYMGWGLVFVTLALETKWHLPILRIMGLILAIITLGLASLTDATIKPLVPALKSWWIMIHVISASIAYALGTMAFILCFLALLKDEARVRKSTFVGISLIFFAILEFCLAGGVKLFSEGAYYVKLLSAAQDNYAFVMDFSKENPAPFFTPMPYTGPLFILAIIGMTLSGIYIYIKRPTVKTMKFIFWLTIFLNLIIFIFILIIDLQKNEILLPLDLKSHLMPFGPWFISFKSHSWSLGLFILLLVFQFLTAFLAFDENKITNILPTVPYLENFAYRIISFSFFLMTIVLITGALWAHYAWGRYWAWDPKETGALAIWLNYAIYLHTKRTPGLSGPVSSLIGVIGFFVIILGFLGVNLGLFMNGLHSYGNS